MKRNVVAGFALALGLLSLNPVASFAADRSNCAKQAAMQEFAKETAPLAQSLRAKELELRKQHAYEGVALIDFSQLQAEVKDLQSQMRSAARDKGLEPCCES